MLDAGVDGGDCCLIKRSQETFFRSVNFMGVPRNVAYCMGQFLTTIHDQR